MLVLTKTMVVYTLSFLKAERFGVNSFSRPRARRERKDRHRMATIVPFFPAIFILSHDQSLERCSFNQIETVVGSLTMQSFFTTIQCRSPSSCFSQFSHLCPLLLDLLSHISIPSNLEDTRLPAYFNCRERCVRCILTARGYLCKLLYGK